jgi:hypothetical protein
VVVELIGVAGTSTRLDRDLQEQSAQCCRRVAIVDALEVNEQTAAVPSVRRNDNLCGNCSIGLQHRAIGKTTFRFVGPYFDRHVAMDAVGASDATDHHCGQVAISSGRSQDQPTTRLSVSRPSP